jgi:outer membrane protein
MTRIALLVAALLAGASAPALAQDSAAADETSGVPASIIARPSAEAAPRASLDEPSGPPLYQADLPRKTPEDVAEASPMQPVATFVEALDGAYWSHPALLSARARLRSADYLLPQARAEAGPKLGYEVSYGYLRRNAESAFLGGWRKSSGWSSAAAAVLTQPVFTFGRLGAADRNAQARIAFERAGLRSTEQETLFNAIAAYAGLLRDRSALDIYREDLELLDRSFSQNTARFVRREVTSSDVQQVETRVEQSRAQLATAQRTAANAEARFLAAIGAPAGAELPAPNPLAMPVRTLEEAYAHAEQNSPVLAAAYARERISRAGMDAARSAMMPRVDLRGRAEYGSVSPYNDSLRETNLQGEVVVSGPIFNSGQLRARAEEAEAANDADWRLIDQALRENRVEVAEAWNDWLTQTAIIDNLRASAAAARLAYEGALLQEKAGFRTTLDVLNLERELLVARVSYNAATANAYIAQARLLAAIGALERSWLFPDAPAHDPDKHFDRTKFDGALPVVPALLRNFDALFSGGRRDRPVRDPAGPLAPAGVDLPVPVTPAPPAQPASEAEGR